MKRLAVLVRARAWPWCCRAASMCGSETAVTGGLRAACRPDAAGGLGRSGWGFGVSCWRAGRERDVIAVVCTSCRVAYTRMGW